MATKKNQGKGNSKMATRKSAAVPVEKEETRDDLGSLVRIPLDQIDFDSFANCRSAGWEKATSSGTKDEGASYEELVASIEATGQKDPITVRPKPGKGNRKPYECIKGFRRGKAVAEIASKQQIAEPTIKAIIKELSDLEATEENVFENTARDNLSSSDLAHAANNLLMRYQAAGMTVSVNQLAKRMGKNQSYLNSLIKIVATAPKLAEKWRNETVVIPVTAMSDIAALPVTEQEAAYERAKAGKAIGGQSRSSTTPDQKAVNLADRMGNLFGRLEALGLLKLKLEWNPESLRILGVDPKDVSKDGWTAAGAKGAESFTKAYDGVKENQKKAKLASKGESASEESASN